MEISDVRRRTRDAIEQWKRQSAERRARQDAAARAWSAVLTRVVVPVTQQISQVLRAEGYPVQVFTPADRVRISAERSGEDYVELSLETDGSDAVLVAHSSRQRGRETIADERVLVRGAEAIAALRDEELLDYLLESLARVLER